jgi:hypothetical protein
MSRTIRAIAGVILAGIIASLAGTMAANAATTHGTGWYDTATCRAFWAYEHRHASRDFTVMSRLARHADTYLRVDVALWHADRARHATLAVRHRDAGFVRDDCTGTGD